MKSPGLEQAEQGRRHWLFIVNPASRSGATLRLAERLQNGAAALAGLDRNQVRVHVTSEPGEAAVVSEKLAPEVDVVVAVGGDGTVHEVASGLLRAACNTAMGVVPAGTGNDFARELRMPGRVDEALRALSGLNAVRADAGQVDWRDERGEHTSFFVNAVGVGFDAYAASMAPRFKHLPFNMGYLSTVLVALQSWKNTRGTVRGELPSADWPAQAFDYNGSIFMVTVGNARDSGGGFRVNPRADITDGLLDVCLVHGISRTRALTLLPRAVRGSHLGKKGIDYWHSADILIETGRAIPIHADGEILTRSADSMRIRVLPGALSVLVHDSHRY